MNVTAMRTSEDWPAQRLGACLAGPKPVFALRRRVVRHERRSVRAFHLIGAEKANTSAAQKLQNADALGTRANMQVRAHTNGHLQLPDYQHN